MPYASVLVHQAVPITLVRSGDRIEGERDESEVEGPPFPCALFPPAGYGGTAGGGTSAATGIPRGRRSNEPLLLLPSPDDPDAPDLTGVNKVRFTSLPGLPDFWLGTYDLVAPPQPFGRPGQSPVGQQAYLNRVVEAA